MDTRHNIHVTVSDMRLGSGQSGIVFAGTMKCDDVGCECAVKEIRLIGAPVDNYEKMLLRREARVWDSVSKKAVNAFVQLYCTHLDESSCFFVMERMHSTLAAALRHHEALRRADQDATHLRNRPPPTCCAHTNCWPSSASSTVTSSPKTSWSG